MVNIRQDLLPIGQGVRTGKKLAKCLGLVIHWIGAAQGHAGVIRNNFARSECGTHYVADWYTGEILRCVPEDEVCYHVGAKSYTDLKRRLCGGQNPNWYFVGIECCIGDRAIPADWPATGKHMELGRPSDVQYEALVAFAADFLSRHGLTADDLYRHYDITGKLCHVWFCKDFGRWKRFKQDVRKEMEGNGMTKEEVAAMVDKAVERALAERDAAVAQAAQRVSPWAAESWEKACRKGVYDGTKPGGCMTREMDAVVKDRLGQLD